MASEVNVYELDLNKTFGERLTDALYEKGHKEYLDQLTVLAKFCGVTIKSARKYLHTEKYSHRTRGLNLNKLIKLCAFLECELEWLMHGKGFSPRNLKWINWTNSLPQDIKKIVLKGSYKMAIRLLNNDAKVKRLMQLVDTGQMSRIQFYNLL